MPDIKTAQEIIEDMNRDDDSLPLFTIEQILLAQKGYDSFIEDCIVFATGKNLEIPVPIFCFEDVEKLSGN